nr:extracellular solute-binding protein [uncultured Cellulosilyticum sp.]
MQKKYIIIFNLILLCIISGAVIYLSYDKKEVSIIPIESIHEKTTIDFMSSWGAYDSKADRLKLILKNLNEKYPNLTIKDSSMAGEDFLFILKTDFASGNPPDLFGLWPGLDFETLVANHRIADLTDVLKEDQEWYERFKASSWDYVTINDRIYGLPIEAIYEGLFINQDLFDAYDVKIPTTFEELLEAVKIFKANGIIPIAYNSTPEGSYLYQNIIMKLGGKEDVEHPFDNEGNMKPCFLEGMKYMKILYENGAFPEDIFTLDDKARNDLFLQKKAAMIVQGSWFIGDNVLDENDTSVKIIAFPDIKGGKADSSAIIYGLGNGILHISQNAWEDPNKREACLNLLKDFTSEETIRVLKQGSGFISGTYIEETVLDGAVIRQGNDLVDQAKELVGPVDSFIDRNLWEDIIVKQIPNVFKGTVSEEQVFEWVKLIRNERSIPQGGKHD